MYTYTCLQFWYVASSQLGVLFGFQVIIHLDHNRSHFDPMQDLSDAANFTSTETMTGYISWLLRTGFICLQTNYFHISYIGIIKHLYRVNLTLKWLKLKKKQWDLAINLTIARVAKCHRYGRYICVKILEGWGKKCGRPCSSAKYWSCVGIFQQLIWSSVLKPSSCNSMFSICSP